MVVTRPTVTGILDTLEGLGLVSRGAHGSDRRMRLVALTDAGQDLVRRALPEVHRFEEELFGALERSEQAALLRSLATISGRIESLAAKR
jgi:DNA-binding MarR family transcriptional regulator